MSHYTYSNPFTRLCWIATKQKKVVLPKNAEKKQRFVSEILHTQKAANPIWYFFIQ